MDSLTYSVLDFCENIDRQTSLRGLIEAFTSAIRSFGFTRFSITRLKQEVGGRLAVASIAHNLPQAWLDRYSSENYAKHDLVADFAYGQLRPWTWIEARERIRATPISKKIAAEAAEFAMVDGLIVALHDSLTTQALVSLASERKVQPTGWERKLLHMACLHAQIRAIEIMDQKRRAHPNLSHREREVLTWLAGGHNLTQTAEILDLSRTTVKSYVEAARLKMDAASTTQAVVAAIRLKQIKV
ncbi:helix-turn-helix transcriptional regulator [Devosia submarina]|uniref:helix-turn-helix transcriptional regulator n=1 Tax=Devosia submarina TaxID=1173082 RepID=UPI001474D2BF|nr:LuxR family transcriptional regulator [Devosia submarina]